MFIIHVALQGCLRGTDVEYGISADTGGHIRYLLQLVAASARDPRIGRIDIVTRAFEAPFSDGDYQAVREQLDPKVCIVRIPTPEPGYLAKEALWPELPALTASLNDYIAGLDRRPDYLHAHYADAAEVAAGVRERHGIPFVFAAHSLGRIKQRHHTRAGGALNGKGDALERRIGFEERALRQASLVVASSRDEAEVQYADYANFNPGKIRIIEPGSDLDMFEHARSTGRVDRLLGRFLSDPDKPALLAIARPVTRKNLSTLITAYGESAALQARANLVILAGNRNDLDRLEPELATNLRQILCLIDRYDLYGRVAYPKQHRADDVPAIYAWARERGGLFVNPALNEPFGLTLLEAAAAGLPVVATDNGGPNDIIAQCGNGLLVDPCSANSIAEAALSLLGDSNAWRRCANNGSHAVKTYNWPRHVSRYHALLERLANPPPRPDEAARAMLVCDIDGTLTGPGCDNRAFNDWHARQWRMAFGVATGRSFHSALSVLEHVDSTLPDFLITSVGTEIYHRAGDGTTFEPDSAWWSIMECDWDRTAIETAMCDFPGLAPQAPLEQCRYKLSYFSDPGSEDIAARVRAHLRARRLRCRVIYSHARYLDILPARAGKGAAVEYMRKRFGLSAEQVYVAGDSGNDIDMLRRSPRSIIVANCRDGLRHRPGLEHAYRARASHAGGVMEGVAYFRKSDRKVS